MVTKWVPGVGCEAEETLMEITGPGGAPGNDSGEHMVEPQRSYTVSEAPLPTQPNGMPSETSDWELSWSRTRNLMRLRLGRTSDECAADGREWYFKEAGGRARIYSANADTGRVYIRCQVAMQGETAFLFLEGEEAFQEFRQGEGCVIVPDDAVGAMRETGQNQVIAGLTLHPLPEQETRLPHTQWRLCYNRAGRDWRLRNERLSDLWLVKDYQGEVALNWFDHGSHVFHEGPVVITPDGVAHLINPELEAAGA